MRISDRTILVNYKEYIGALDVHFVLCVMDKRRRVGNVSSGSESVCHISAICINKCHYLPTQIL